MTDSQLLPRIDENVKYLRQSFDEHKAAFEAHVKKDEQISKDFILPLWNAHQQQVGGFRFGGIIGNIVTGLVAGLGVYLGVKH